MHPKRGDVVRVCYTAALDSGEIADAAHREQPFDFQLGAGLVIPGFEQAILTMEEGESKQVRIPPEEAYGPYRDDWVSVVARSKLTGLAEPRVGMMLRVGPSDAKARNVTITAVDGKTVTLDGNHRLAGQALTFQIQLVAINPG